MQNLPLIFRYRDFYQIRRASILLDSELSICGQNTDVPAMSILNWSLWEDFIIYYGCSYPLTGLVCFHLINLIGWSSLWLLRTDTQDVRWRRINAASALDFQCLFSEFICWKSHLLHSRWVRLQETNTVFLSLWSHCLTLTDQQKRWLCSLKQTEKTFERFWTNINNFFTWL